MSRNHPSGARLRAVIAKELCHIVRDWQTLMIVIAMPVVMMFLYGYAINVVHGAGHGGNSGNHDHLVADRIFYCKGKRERHT